MGWHGSDLVAGAIGLTAGVGVVWWLRLKNQRRNRHGFPVTPD